MPTTELIDRYFAVWNESDVSRRRKLIRDTWAEGASYLDPMLKGDGHDGIDAMVQAVQDKYPACRFRRTSEVDVHHDRARFTWTFAPEVGPAVVSGLDIAVLAADGRLQAITGFFDPAQAA